MVTEEQYREELDRINRTGAGLVGQAEAHRLGYAYVDLARVALEPSILATLSARTAHDITALPVKLDGKTLFVCVVVPPKPSSIERLGVETGCRIVPVCVVEEALILSIAHYYGPRP